MIFDIIIPEWADFIYQNPSGQWFVFEYIPKYNASLKQWLPVLGAYKYLCTTEIDKDTNILYGIEWVEK